MAIETPDEKTRKEMAEACERIDAIALRRWGPAGATFLRSTYGKKGLPGPTRGRPVAIYEAELPDGTVIRKRTTIVHEPTAYIGCFWDHPSKTWVTTGVFREPLTDTWQKFLPAVKTSALLKRGKRTSGNLPEPLSAL